MNLLDLLPLIQDDTLYAPTNIILEFGSKINISSDEEKQRLRIRLARLSSVFHFPPNGDGRVDLYGIRCLGWRGRRWKEAIECHYLSDDVKNHFGDPYFSTHPREHALTHIGMFLAYCHERRFFNESMKKFVPTSFFEEQTGSFRDFAQEYFDGRIEINDFNSWGSLAARTLYPMYLDRFGELLCPGESKYSAADTWNNFGLVCELLDTWLVTTGEGPHIDIFHLSDVYHLITFPIEELLAYLIQKGKHKPDVLIITGVTKDGNESTFRSILPILQNLISCLDLETHQIILEPSPNDLLCGFGPFTHFYQALFGEPYDHKSVRIVDIHPYLQIIGMFSTREGISPTHFLKGMDVAKSQRATRLASLYFHRALVHANPSFLSENMPLKEIKDASRQDNLKLAFFGNTYANMQSPFLTSFGSEFKTAMCYTFFPIAKRIGAHPIYLQPQAVGSPRMMTWRLDETS